MSLQTHLEYGCIDIHLTSGKLFTQTCLDRDLSFKSCWWQQWVAGIRWYDRQLVLLYSFSGNSPFHVNGRCTIYAHPKVSHDRSFIRPAKLVFDCVHGMPLWVLQGTDTSAADPFVPTVTAISTSRDLRWMVQPTVLTSVTPSSGRAKSKARGATQSSSTADATKAKPSNRKGQREQVCESGEGGEVCYRWPINPVLNQWNLIPYWRR